VARDGPNAKHLALQAAMVPIGLPPRDRPECR
jgi:hypothetical protein